MKRVIKVFRANKREKLLSKLLSLLEKPEEEPIAGKVVVLEPVMLQEGRPLGPTLYDTVNATFTSENFNFILITHFTYTLNSK